MNDDILSKLDAYAETLDVSKGFTRVSMCVLSAARTAYVNAYDTSYESVQWVNDLLDFQCQYTKKMDNMWETYQPHTNELSDAHRAAIDALRADYYKAIDMLGDFYEKYYNTSKDKIKEHITDVLNTKDFNFEKFSEDIEEYVNNNLVVQTTVFPETPNKAEFVPLREDKTPTLVIYDYDGKPCNTGISLEALYEQHDTGDGVIEKIEMLVLSGDEVINVTYDTGEVVKIDSSDCRMIDYDDGGYTLYNANWLDPMVIINNQKFTDSNNTYDRQGIGFAESFDAVKFAKIQKALERGETVGLADVAFYKNYMEEHKDGTAITPKLELYKQYYQNDAR